MREARRPEAMAKKAKSLAAAAGVALAVAAVVLLPLGAFFLWRVSMDKPGLREEPAVETSLPEGSAPARPHVFAASEEPEERPRPRVKAAAATLTPEPPPKPAARAPAPAGAPAPITAGLEKSKLIAGYGKPQMVTVGMENGQQVETYHYLQRDTGTEIIVRLRGGRVVSVGTTVY